MPEDEYLASPMRGRMRELVEPRTAREWHDALAACIARAAELSPDELGALAKIAARGPRVRPGRPGASATRIRNIRAIRDVLGSKAAAARHLVKWNGLVPDSAKKVVDRASRAEAAEHARNLELHAAALAGIERERAEAAARAVALSARLRKALAEVSRNDAASSAAVAPMTTGGDRNTP